MHSILDSGDLRVQYASGNVWTMNPDTVVTVHDDVSLCLEHVLLCVHVHLYNTVHKWSLFIVNIKGPTCSCQIYS